MEEPIAEQVRGREERTESREGETSGREGRAESRAGETRGQRPESAATRWEPFESTMKVEQHHTEKVLRTRIFEILTGV